MRIHCLQHVDFEGPGHIGTWLAAHGHVLTTTTFWTRDAALPALDAFDALLILGGPMSVNDEQQLPWLRDEKRFVRDCMAAGKPVLGICLGAQLIASALGARVFSNPVREIGWFDIHPLTTGGDDLLRLTGETRVFHWHGETFDLPAGARLLASSAACVNQVFQIGERVIGLQCHLETTPEAAQALVAHCGDELQPAAWVQSEAEILAAPASAYAQAHAVLDGLLTRLFRD